MVLIVHLQTLVITLLQFTAHKMQQQQIAQRGNATSVELFRVLVLILKVQF